MKIGQLADKTGLSIQTIRFYERKALLSAPERTQSNYRSYSEEALKQLLFIKQCRALDMTIEEISLVLETRANPESSCESVNATIDKHIDDIEQRVMELNALRQSLISIRSTCADNKKVKECGVLHQLDSIAETRTTPKNII
ncbi:MULTISPECIES: Cd(II)/Pb(II)-responsive transcriptional regulator [Alteromonadaceae]|jgi:Cd(II)/Pb(II)-responsive transcriptional regulator|uniref:Cd(II)/Pb(II)-responsive transcriptional regulator n=1 Tax=Brumicola blandensis TaxID=3075611 RepID=A0AAW8QWH3_9ALTE|nr:MULTISPECIES: Cd(II)/Pb(II)-responsive transcriptional regulator [Alteromonadaceae]MBT1452145.1 Cd(II)/Pb(II)-responsive transcriptional regulator [Glaciecola sp. XM2]MDT0581493.1 Cd(II)/Pb(II)-responsive transcriptional regulator [Alteromonas sp. W409]MDT0627111.1 Cd(II)/Pb(II)-responsive transcriptional regulator [Alteromonas sp. W364]